MLQVIGAVCVGFVLGNKKAQKAINTAVGQAIDALNEGAISDVTPTAAENESGNIAESSNTYN